MGVLRQLSASQRLAYAVIADVGDLSQSFEQAERLEDAGIDADADTWLPSLDFLQGRARRESPLGHHRHRQPATPARVMDVRTELAQRVSHGGGRVMRR